MKRIRGDNMKKIAAMMCVLALAATIHFRYYFEIAGHRTSKALKVDKVIDLTNEGATVILNGKKYYFPNDVFYYIDMGRSNEIRKGTYNK